jgi:hypothetical protein
VPRRFLGSITKTRERGKTVIKETCTNGNGRNCIRGSRVRLTCTECGELVAEVFMPAHGGRRYANMHPNGWVADGLRVADEVARAHKCVGGK